MTSETLEQRLRHYGAVLEQQMSAELAPHDRDEARQPDTAVGSEGSRGVLVLAAAAIVAVIAAGLAMRTPTNTEDVAAVESGSGTTTPVEANTTAPRWPMASTGDVTDSSRLLSDGVPDGLELVLAADNADLDAPHGDLFQQAVFQAAYVDPSGLPALWVSLIDSPEPGASVAETYANQRTVDIGGVDVIVHGGDFRQAAFTIDATSIRVSGPWDPNRTRLTDDQLIAAASAIVEAHEPEALPTKILGFDFAGVEEQASYPAGPEGAQGAPDGSTTIYAPLDLPRGVESVEPGDPPPEAVLSPYIEIRSRPAIEGRYIPYEVRAGAGEAVEVGGVPAVTSRHEYGVVNDEDLGLTWIPITGPGRRSLHLRIGGHQIMIVSVGLSRSQLLAVASSLRTASPEEWGVGVP